MSDEGLAEAAATINALAADVVEQLAALREQLEPSREHWAGSHAYLGPADEWTIAADGLFGASGVLSTINDVLRVTTPDFAAAGWAETGRPGDGRGEPMGPPRGFHG